MYYRQGAENERECRNCTHNWSRDEDDLSKEGDTPARARRASSAALTSSLKGALMIPPPLRPPSLWGKWSHGWPCRQAHSSRFRLATLCGEKSDIIMILAILTKLKAMIKSFKHCALLVSFSMLRCHSTWYQLYLCLLFSHSVQSISGPFFGRETRGQWPFRPAATWAMESLTTGIWAGGKVSLSWGKWEPALPGLYLYAMTQVKKSCSILFNLVQNGLPTLQILFYLV